MKIIAYSYVDPLLDEIPDSSIWGWEIDQIYQDIGKRKELHQLMNDCQMLAIDYLLILSLYELGDNLSDVIKAIAKIEESGTEIITLNQDYQTSKFKVIKDQETKKKIQQIWSEISEIYKKRKLRKSHAKNRLKILPPPGKTPYGYLRGKDSYIINRATAPIVRAFFDRFLLYASIRDSVRFLASKYNKKITPSTARYWLTNPVYRGDLRYQNQQIISDTHTSIISREEAAQIERIFKSHSRVKPRSASASYCLAGLVQCAKCQSKFKITSVTQKYKKKKYLYLTPTNCLEEKHCKSIPYQIIIKKVIADICGKFKFFQNITTPDLELIKKDINQQIKSKQDIINSLDNLISSNVLDQQTASIRNYQLETEIADLKTKLAQLPPNNLEAIAKTLSLEQFWYDLSEEERRFYLREFVELIKITPSNNSKEKWNLDLDFCFSNPRLNNSCQNK